MTLIRMAAWHRIRTARRSGPVGPVGAAARAVGLALLIALGAVSPPASAADKVLRLALGVAETGFDPAQISDLYSRTITTHIFDALYEFDYLARPYKVVPNTAAGMPEVSDDFRVWTIHIQPGIHFADDPAFNGQPRELTAEDYAYSWKRFYDPELKSQQYAYISQLGVLGLDGLRERALKDTRPFDYDAPVEGLKVLDRYTLQFRLAQPRPRFVEVLTDSSILGAVAREVVERYGAEIMAHPVGTGPFKLSTWRRSSHIELVRNPGYREVLYDADPAPDDALGQALLKRFKGRRLPMIDRVELDVVEGSQPRWLSFLAGTYDTVSVPLPFAQQAAPNGELAPNLAKQGMTLRRTVLPSRMLFYFNMDDPVVGGMAPEKVALRRAIGLGTNAQRIIDLVFRGQGILAQDLTVPHTWGYDPHYRSINSEFDPAKAQALLDVYGYVDRDGDGWRDLPDGRPLVIEEATQSDDLSRQLDELWQKDMADIHIRWRPAIAQWPENLRKAQAGTLQLWALGYYASVPDVQDNMALFYGPSIGQSNLSRFKSARYDAIYDRMQALPNNDERRALLDEAKAIVTAYAPAHFQLYQIAQDLTQPWLLGYLRPPFSKRVWDRVDIDDSLRPAK